METLRLDAPFGAFAHTQRVGESSTMALKIAQTNKETKKRRRANLAVSDASSTDVAASGKTSGKGKKRSLSLKEDARPEGTGRAAGAGGERRLKKTEEVDEETRSRHAEMLATQWLTATDLRKLKEEEGLVYRSGAYTGAERQQIVEALKDYQTRYGLTDAELLSLIHAKKTSDAIGAHKDFWSDITRAVPFRSKHSVYRAVAKSYHPWAHKGPFTEEEDTTIKKMYNEIGNNWNQISKIVERHPDDVKDRWRFHLDRTEQVKKGRWSADESEALTQAVEEVCAIQDIPLDDGQGIMWQAVAEKLGRTRQPKQCRNKWFEVLLPRLKAQTDTLGPWTSVHGIALIESIISLRPRAWEHIDWHAVLAQEPAIAPYGLARAQRRTKFYLKTIYPHYDTQPDLTDVLKDQVLPILHDWDSRTKLQPGLSKAFITAEDEEASDDDMAADSGGSDGAPSESLKRRRDSSHSDPVAGSPSHASTLWENAATAHPSQARKQAPSLSVRALIPHIDLTSFNPSAMATTTSASAGGSHTQPAQASKPKLADGVKGKGKKSEVKAKTKPKIPASTGSRFEMPRNASAPSSSAAVAPSVPTSTSEATAGSSMPSAVLPRKKTRKNSKIVQQKNCFTMLRNASAAPVLQPTPASQQPEEAGLTQSSTSSNPLEVKNRQESTTAVNVVSDMPALHDEVDSQTARQQAREERRAKKKAMKAQVKAEKAATAAKARRKAEKAAKAAAKAQRKAEKAARKAAKAARKEKQKEQSTTLTAVDADSSNNLAEANIGQAASPSQQLSIGSTQPNPNGKAFAAGAAAMRETETETETETAAREARRKRRAERKARKGMKKVKMEGAV